VRRLWTAASLALLAALPATVYFLRPSPITTTETTSNASENRYVDAAVCADCHPAIAETYRRTGMGRSFEPPSRSNTLGGSNAPVTYFHKASDSYFTMAERDGRFYQRRYQIGFDGKETNSIEKEIHFVLGSGNHARAFLSRTSRNTFVELPLAWYSEGGGAWAMNPGYDRPDHAGFTRAITYGCMFCHNAIPDGMGGSAARAQPGGEPVFPERMPEGIDCQRCHGPGGKHVDLAGAAAAVEETRRAIVNPARLSAERQIEVCMQCHLETTSFRLPNSIVRFDRLPFSYRPGESLADFVLHFDHAPGSGHDDKFEIAGSAYRLRQSACFLKSEGKLGCTSCHNPHDMARGEQAAAHYTEVCRQCHGAAFEQVVASGRHTKSSDCLGCHMPKRRTDDVVHAVMTDHYIQRRKPSRDLLAPIAERRETEENGYRGPVALYYPQSLPEGRDRDLYLAVAHVSQKADLSDGIQRLTSAIEKHRPDRMEFYLQLADAWKDAGQIDKAIPLYEEAVRREPRSLIALQRLGFALRSAGQAAQAVEVLKRALAVDGRDAASWHQLGLLHLAQGARNDALAAFEKAIELDPDLFEAYNSAAGVRLEGGNLAQAEPAFRDALNVRPDYAEAHSNLANVLASTNRFDEARYHFEAALRFKPDFAAARFNYGVALAKLNRYDEAQRQIELALKSNPGFREAQEALKILKSR
jgi:predicted CXXCH cytochrome family protein